MGVLKPEGSQHVPRRRVVWMMTGNECSRTEHVERMCDHGRGGFSSESHAPVTATQMEPDFIDVWFGFKRQT
jgi:hypothetical protein